MGDSILEQLPRPQAIREEIANVTARRDVLKRLLRVAEFAAHRRDRLPQTGEPEGSNDA